MPARPPPPGQCEMRHLPWGYLSYSVHSWVANAFTPRCWRAGASRWATELGALAPKKRGPNPDPSARSGSRLVASMCTPGASRYPEPCQIVRFSIAQMDKRSDAMTGARPGAASMIDFHAADIRGDSMGLVSKAVRATLRHTGIVLLLSSAITVFATAPEQADILSDSSHNLDDMLAAVIDSSTNTLDPASQTSPLLKIVECSAPRPPRRGSQTGTRPVQTFHQAQAPAGCHQV